MGRIGCENLAVQATPGTTLVHRHTHIHRKRAHHHGEGDRRHARRVALARQLRHGARAHLEGGYEQQHADGKRAVGLELGVSVGVPRIGGTGRQADTDEPDDVAERVEHRVDAVGLHRGGPRGETVEELRRRHHQVQGENDPENPLHLPPMGRCTRRHHDNRPLTLGK